jgi:menaquinone-dependent protoporphyrinogen oxidase
VCLGILQKDERVQNEEREFVENFFKRTNWYPASWAIFAGALPYSKYGWFLKRIMRRIAHKAGRETDINQDYEFTNWDEVRNFTEKFLIGLNTSNPNAGICPVEVALKSL